MKKLIVTIIILFAASFVFANEEFDVMLKLAQDGNPTACYNMSLCYQYGYLDTEPDNDKAVYWAKKAADLGVSDAMVDVGIYYLSFENNWKLAKKYFEQGAEKNNPYAYYMLGLCYSNALNVKKDIKKGLENYKKASGIGCPPADYQLGILYYLGDDVPEDRETAILYFKKAAQAGNADAQKMLEKLGL